MGIYYWTRTPAVLFPISAHTKVSNSLTWCLLTFFYNQSKLVWIKTTWMRSILQHGLKSGCQTGSQNPKWANNEGQADRDRLEVTRTWRSVNRSSSNVCGIQPDTWKGNSVKQKLFQDSDVLKVVLGDYILTSYLENRELPDYRVLIYEV